MAETVVPLLFFVEGEQVHGNIYNDIAHELSKIFYDDRPISVDVDFYVGDTHYAILGVDVFPTHVEINFFVLD